ncbi:hypothetical protein ABT381_34815, partial [Streptomyces sp. NPDC000151]|uniref:hypothetical protein n=1 Tax=Streptomyces sp. NPDC000151 TaxID=3154244 RepID=UPI00332D53BC
GGEEAAAPGFGPGLDRDRAAAVLPTLHALLGGGPDDEARALITTCTGTATGTATDTSTGEMR